MAQSSSCKSVQKECSSDNIDNKHSEEDPKGVSLCSGYCRLESNNMNIIQDIIAIIYTFFGGLYQILAFDPEYKASKVEIIDNKTAASPNGGYYYVLGGGEPVTHGIFVWRIKVDQHVSFQSCLII